MSTTVKITKQLFSHVAFYIIVTIFTLKGYLLRLLNITRIVLVYFILWLDKVHTRCLLGLWASGCSGSHKTRCEGRRNIPVFTVPQQLLHVHLFLGQTAEYRLKFG